MFTADQIRICKKATFWQEQCEVFKSDNFIVVIITNQCDWQYQSYQLNLRMILLPLSLNEGLCVNVLALSIIEYCQAGFSDLLSRIWIFEMELKIWGHFH